MVAVLSVLLPTGAGAGAVVDAVGAVAVVVGADAVVVGAASWSGTGSASSSFVAPPS